jgi:hypothetical protein
MEELPLKALEAELPLKALEILYREGKITREECINLYNICRNYTKRYNYEKKIVKQISDMIAIHYKEFLDTEGQLEQSELLYLKLLESME